MKRLIVIAGPTASGKTSLSVALAKHLETSIISADSRQFYKELAIGTAKPTKEEQSNVPHYFIDSHPVETPLSAGQFEKEAMEVVNQLFQTKDTLILVGGSGMFIDALIYGTDQLPHAPEIRNQLNRELEEHGIEALQATLKEVDPAYYREVDLKNPVRLIRALEVFRIKGIPYSQLLKGEKKPRFKTFFFVIDHPREVLYDRINRRVDLMVEEGLFKEAEHNLHYRNLQPLNTVGYKEIFDFFDEKITYERAIELIKQNTRRYAKRQLTWFRREKNAIWLNAADNEIMLKEILKAIQE